MLSMDVVFTQILVILLYILIGFVAGKIRLINPEQRKYLTSICANLILPFTILSASNQSLSLRQMGDLGLSLALMLGLFFLTTLVALLVQRRAPAPVKVTTASLVTYPNCTFLGLPLCRALFGDIAILYNAVAIIAFNALFFTWQCSMFTGKKFRPQNLATPGTVATLLLILMLFFGIHLPAPVQTVASSTGAMITPLSLIIIGVMMSENRIILILKERRAYVITLFRNLVIPLAAMLLLLLLPGNGPARLCQLVYMACPCATLTSIYAIQNDMEPELAARSVLMSTLMFAATLPLILSIGMRVLA
ncbi:MAG: AEC family transporter [Clostridia bacterium]|nr:AEC family transporter [Clostridia bacterium]